MILRAHELDTPLIDLLGEEVVRDAPGQEAVLDRLLDLLLITLLRTWFDRPQSDPPAWYAAQGDPVVGPALRLMQHHPEHPWTVADLADRAGVSRASFARRFTELVGEPPMAFLIGWRIALAADLLLEPDATIATRRAAGRLRDAVRAECGVQARARDQPPRPPAPRGRGSRRPPARLGERYAGWRSSQVCQSMPRIRTPSWREHRAPAMLAGASSGSTVTSAPMWAAYRRTRSTSRSGFGPASSTSLVDLAGGQVEQQPRSRRCRRAGSARP